MCGIIGMVPNRGFDTTIHELGGSFLSAVAHRGPDDEGHVLINRLTGNSRSFSGAASPSSVRAEMPPMKWAGAWAEENNPDLALGHRRFSIISPTAEGHQPFFDHSGQVCLVLNGEIYNYIEIRDELRRDGCAFVTATDTEVLAQAYVAWGDRCFEKLNGMWAVAIYDFGSRELILCRDRTGERPLYWARRPEGVYFASEIKALLAVEPIASSTGVDEEAAYEFLHQAVSDVDGKTFFKGIESLPAATIVKIAIDGSITTRRYWQLPESRTSDADAPDAGRACEELRSILRSSVELRLRADVPINIALSGGLDSSSIVAMAARLKDSDLDTYTVRFEEAEWNEWPFAQTVAKKFRVRNLVAEPDAAWLWSHLEQFVRAMEEPFHAPDLVVDHAVRWILHKKGIKVSLSGIGGDELFAGYQYHRDNRALDLKRSGHRLAGLREMFLASDRSRSAAAFQMVLGKLRRLAVPPVQSLSTMAIITPDHFKLRDLPDTCEERLRADIEWALLPYWLRAGDKSSMAVPIEVRYPFLDHRLIEFAARLPVSYLIRDGWLKWILRKAMEPLLPSEIIWRRRKMGFPFPIREKLLESVAYLKLIFERMDNPFLNRGFWVNRLPEAIDQEPWLVWRALSFELWHRHYIRAAAVIPEQLNERVVAAGVDPGWYAI